MYEKTAFMPPSPPKRNKALLAATLLCSIPFSAIAQGGEDAKPSISTEAQQNPFK